MGGARMSKFDYFNFSDGSWDVEFVVHAKKFTKDEVLELFIVENKHLFNEGYRKPNVDDIVEKTVRWYPIAPEGCDFEDGCYSYCKKGERGSFPVWTIEFEELKIDNP